MYKHVPKVHLIILTLSNNAIMHCSQLLVGICNRFFQILNASKKRVGYAAAAFFLLRSSWIMLGTRTSSSGQHSSNILVKYSGPTSLNKAEGRNDLYIKDQHSSNILVIYSGPTSLNKAEGRNDLYIKNFEYFIRHGGIECEFHDTILVVGHPVYPQYKSEVVAMNNFCTRNFKHTVSLHVREDVCLDMESVRTVMYSKEVETSKYHYFIYVNCGMSGPGKRRWPWVLDFISKLNRRTRMVGLTHSCYGIGEKNGPGNLHIQSFAFALDKQGWEIVKSSGAVYDCRFGHSNRHAVIELYEVGMSQAILKSNFSIFSILMNQELTLADEPCSQDDMWYPDKMKSRFKQILFLNETLFFKSSRFLTPEIVEQLNITSEKVCWKSDQWYQNTGALSTVFARVQCTPFTRYWGVYSM